MPNEESLMGVINYYIGTPYRYGGCEKDGMDCSCFVQRVFDEALDIKLPRTAAEQWQYGKEVDKSELAFGDIVFFRTSKGKNPSHCGIYLGGNRFVHASSSLGVTVTPLTDSYWAKKYIGARRIISR